MKKFKGRKMNNKGMSLVEVLVAMIIISVAGISFLQSFSSSVRNNARAREKQHALVLAQSMMETFKAYPIEDLDNAVGTSPFSIYTTGAASGSIVINTPVSDVHTYEVNGIDFNGYKYDAKMTLNPTTDVSAVVTNTASIGQIHNPDNTKDAEIKQDFYLEQDGVMSAVWNYLIACDAACPGIRAYVESGYIDSSMLDKNLIHCTSRELQINISASKQVTMTASYAYDLQDFYYIDKDGNDAVLSGGSFSWNHTYNAGSFAGLNSIYLFYYPAYKSDGVLTSITENMVLCDSDEIKVYNNSGTAVDLYVVKQELPNTPNMSVITPYETAYSVSITGPSNVNLYSNLNKHLYQNSNKTYVCSGFNEVNDKLFKEKEEKLVFDATVNVYKSGTSDLIYSLTGTTNYR